MGDWPIFLKNLCDTSLNKDLSNEPTFAGSISLDSPFKQKFLKKQFLSFILFQSLVSSSFIIFKDNTIDLIPVSARHEDFVDHLHFMNILYSKNY
jgi:hypothetical protein